VQRKTVLKSACNAERVTQVHEIHCHVTPHYEETRSVSRFTERIPLLPLYLAVSSLSVTALSDLDLSLHFPSASTAGFGENQNVPEFVFGRS
jgi:hypothetical protein